MTMMIDGFSIEPHTDNSFIFKRAIEPQHEYMMTLDPIKVLQTLPADVAEGDPLDDAERFEGEVIEAAKKCRDQLFPDEYGQRGYTNWTSMPSAAALPVPCLQERGRADDTSVVTDTGRPRRDHRDAPRRVSNRSSPSVSCLTLYRGDLGDSGRGCKHGAWHARFAQIA